MSPDLLSVTLRAAAFICLFQAAGTVLFVALCGGGLSASRIPITRLGCGAALFAAPLLLVHAAIGAARMAGDYAGLADAGLQRLGWYSPDGAAQTLQATGALCIAAALRGGAALEAQVWRARPLALIGALLALLPFLLTGHTSVQPLRALLAPLLAVHVLVIAFWFGALAPLYVVVLRESAEVAARTLQTFSAYATWLVPLILIAGVTLACVLVPSLAELRQPYGELLLAKLAGFALLMGLAALNRSRLVPALSLPQRHESAARALRWSLVAEICLLSAILTVTAVLTTFFSPQH